MDWNPIGVHGIPEAADEYDSYTKPIYSILGVVRQCYAHRMNSVHRSATVPPPPPDSVGPDYFGATALGVAVLFPFFYLIFIFFRR